MNKLYLALALLFVGAVSTQAQAQEKELTVHDAVAGRWGKLRPKSLGYTNWIPESNQFVKIVDNTIISVDASNQKESTLLGLDHLNEALSKIGIDALKRMPYFSWINANEMYFKTKGGIVKYNVKTSEATLFEVPSDAQNVTFNKETEYIAYTQNSTLFININGKVEKIMEVDAGYTIGQYVHRNEFGIEKGIFWSNDGKKIAFYTNNENSVTDYTLLDYNNVPATQNVIKYPMTGQNNEEVALYSFDSETNKTTLLKTDADKDRTYLTNVSWTANDQGIIVAQLNRDQDNMNLNVYSAQNGKLISTVLNESSEAYVQPMHPAINLSDDLVLWQSEKSGLNNLYLVNISTKDQKHINTDNLIIREVIAVDAKKQTAYVSANEKDGIDLKVYQVNFKNASNPTIKEITKAEGVHRGFSMNDSYTYALDKYTSLNNPGKTDIIRVSNGSAKNILTASNTLEEYKVGTIELVQFEANNTLLHGRIIKPSNYDASKKYPVLLYVYNGPNVQLVTNSWLGGAPLWMLNMAERGYIIWTVDGRGSENRGLEFEQNIYRQLGVNEMADQVASLEYLSSIASIDKDRVAVHGWSYGGYMTISLLENYADVFNAGVAGGPVTDWKFYEIMYGERYMDTPESNPEGYQLTSTLNKTDQIQDPLMLIHGTSDPVVVMQHSMAFLKNCVDNGVQVDFFAYPGHEHNVLGIDRVHLMTKVLDYIEDKNK